MRKFFQEIRDSKIKTDAHIAEIQEEYDLTLSAMEEVYAERERELNKKMAIITSFLKKGDPEVVIEKVSEALKLMSTSTDESINNRVQEKKLKKIN
jgi:hypothetical protein